jgi:hypothetical protein
MRYYNLVLLNTGRSIIDSRNVSASSHSSLSNPSASVCTAVGIAVTSERLFTLSVKAVKIAKDKRSLVASDVQRLGCSY